MATRGITSPTTSRARVGIVERRGDLADVHRRVLEHLPGDLEATLVHGFLEVGAAVKTDAKVERCTKFAGEVIYDVTLSFNEYFEGRWTPPARKPSKGIEHCVGCHGPDLPAQKAAKWNQQGHMECLMCHTDHLKAAAK